MANHRFWAHFSQGRPGRGCGKPYSGTFQTSKNRSHQKSGVFSFLMAVGLMGVYGVMMVVFPGKADSTPPLGSDEFSPRQGVMDLQLISQGTANGVSDTKALPILKATNSRKTESTTISNIGVAHLVVGGSVLILLKFLLGIADI